MTKIIDITPNSFEEIPAKIKVQIPPTPSMGDVVGGISFGGGDSTVPNANNRSITTIANAINVEGNFVNEIINAKLDTSAKQILGDFTFGVSGAIKMITDEDNGLWISPAGILAKKLGANTLTIGIDGSATYAGTITASAGSIGGWAISATALYYDGATDALSAGMASADYSFYAGKKYADRATAPFRVTPAGAFFTSSATITGGIIDGTSTLGGRLASTIATAIDASGHFADTAINTATSTIITPFTFGTSGALQIGNYVNGISGDLRLSPNGILARDITGATTFSINGDTGVAVLNGLVVGTNVGLGTAQDSAGVTTIINDTVTTGFINARAITVLGEVTAGTLTGLTIRTAADGQRITITGTDNYLRVYSTDGAGGFAQTGSLGGSLDATSRYLQLATPAAVDLEMAMLLAQHPTGTNLILRTASKGYQFNRFTNENTNVYRTTNSVPMLSFYQLGTGSCIKFINNNPDSDGKVFDIEQHKVVTTEPIFKIKQGGIISTNFRKILTETDTGCNIWISDGNTPNGSLSAQAGDICLNGDSGNIYRCTGTTVWVAM